MGSIEFGDRYNQAATYHHLGIVAEELGEFEEAKGKYWQALQIWAEFNDSLRMIRSFLSVVWVIFIKLLKMRAFWQI